MMIEYFTLFLFIAVFLLIGITYVNQNISLNAAREYHQSIVTELQDSDFASSVVDEIQNNAAATNYKVEILDTSIAATKKKYKVTVMFDYRIPLVGMNQTYRVVGYAG